MMSPDFAVSAISNSLWHSGQTITFISQSQEPLQPSPIKTHYDFAIHYDHRSSPPTDLLDKILHRRRILCDVAIPIRDFMVRKKLFHRMARRSTRGRIYSNLVDHKVSSFSRFSV